MAFLLIDMVRFAATLFSILVFARVIISWVSPTLENPLVVLVYRITEPVLGPVRAVLPAMGGIDFSPVLVLIAIQVVEQILVQVLAGMAGGY